MGNIEISIGERVCQKAAEFNLSAPGRVVFAANHNAADYVRSDPRSHNPLRVISARQMDGLAGEILKQELQEMFPQNSFNFIPVELNNIHPSSREWSTLAAANLILVSLATRYLPQGELIARAFGKTIPVVVGGHHVTRNAVPFHEQTDGKVAVVTGRVEGLLPEVLAAIQNGTHRGHTFHSGNFRADHDYHTLSRNGVVTRLFGPNSYGTIIEAGVGCEGGCDFCAILTFSRSDRNPDHLIEEIKRIHRQGINYIMFADDNLSDRDPEFLIKVFSEINSLGIGWIGEGSRKILNDPNVAKTVGQNNIGFLHGIEDEALSGKTKDKSRSFDQIKDDIDRLLRAGFIVIGSVVLGLNNHRFPDTFQEYRNAIMNLNIPVTLHMATPYPGTPFNRKLKEQDRIFDTNPAHYDNGYMVFHPDKMTVEQFLQGFRWLQREIGSPEQAIKVIDNVYRKVGAKKFLRLPRGIASLLWLASDQGFNGTDQATPAELRSYSISLLNLAWPKE